MNESIKLEIDRKECCDMAFELFLEESGVKAGTGRKFQRMYDDAMEIRKLIEDRIEIKAIYSYYEDFQLEGTILKVGDQEFDCRGFEKIERNWLTGAYFYAVTAGDYSLEDRPIMEQLYADIWGTAFADAIRSCMVNRLCSNERMKLSDSFGPGFYGMDTMEMHKMPFLVDYESIGLEVKESGMMLPLKSCAGILFSVNEDYQHLDAACELCYGNAKTCSLCSVRRHLI